MSASTFARQRSRWLAAALVAGVALVGTSTSPAEALKPEGSRIQVIVEAGDQTGLPANGVTSGWWGHEGGANNGTGTIATFPSLDLSDDAGTVNSTTVAAALAALGTDSLDNISYVIVPFSADGSNEDPQATAGQNAGDVFANGRLLSENFVSGGMNGNTSAIDSVTTVSTLSEIKNWVAAGEPDQGYDSSLFLHDTSKAGNPLSAAPRGKSILNAWPAGTHLSLVAYVSAGTDSALTVDNKVPLVAVGADGHAKTAWMPFVTVAKPGDALRTSAGYVVDGAYAPTVTNSVAFASDGASATLTGTVKNKNGAVATDATGNLEFAQVVNGTRQAPTMVAVAAGQAALDISGLTSGSSRTYDVRYVPDVAGQATYLTSEYTRSTLSAPAATTTTLTAVGGATDTFTATASPKVAGKFVFKDGATTLGTVNAPAGVAVLAKKLAVGKHVLSASFTPTSSVYRASTGTRTVFQGTISTTLTPKKGKHGVRPKVTVKVVAPGAVVNGKVTIVFDPPKGATKKFTVAVTNGVAMLKLPKTVKGKTKVTALYGGSSTVLAVNGATVLFTAT